MPAARQGLRKAVTSLLEAAEAAGEIEPCDCKGMAGGLYADYLAGVVACWLADTSEAFADTTQLVDLSLGVLVQALRSGRVNRVLQLGGFVLRSQMARLAQQAMGRSAPAPAASAAAPSASGQVQPDAGSYRVDDRVGIFRIRHLSDTEVVMGQDDKHLDVQVSLAKRGGHGGVPPRWRSAPWCTSTTRWACLHDRGHALPPPHCTDHGAASGPWPALNYPARAGTPCIHSAMPDRR